MRMLRKVICCITAFAMLLSCTSCGGSMKFSKTDPKTTINVMLETPVQSIDPQLATDGTSIELIGDYMDGLMQMDASGAPTFAIAESYEVSDDGLQYIFHLRKDAKWSNGEPVTAHDFIFAWQRAVDPETGSEYSFMLSDIGQIVNAEEIIAGEKDKSELGAKALDDYTIEINLKVPVSYFLSLLYFPTFYPVNEEFYNSCDGKFGTGPSTVLANGAFVLEYYEPSSIEIALEKNEYYYDSDKVQVSGIYYQVIQDSQQALMCYQTGGVDTIKINGDLVDQVRDDPDFISVPQGFLTYISPNMDKVPALKNENIRAALTFAIDRSALTDKVLNDGSIPTCSAVPKDLAVGPDGKDFEENPEQFSEYCRFDKQEAADRWYKGLSEVGISSLELQLTIDSDEETQKVAQVLKEQWETTLPGLTINILVEPKKQRLADMNNGDYELGLTRWGPDYADPMTYLELWTEGSVRNYGKWECDEYNEIIDRCSTGDLCTNVEERWTAMKDAETLVMQDYVIFPLYTQCSATLISSKVSGIEYHTVALSRVYKNAVKEH